MLGLFYFYLNTFYLKYRTKWKTNHKVMQNYFKDTQNDCKESQNNNKMMQNNFKETQN